MNQHISFSVIAIATLLPITALGQVNNESVAPKSLLIYYGHPSAINGAQGIVAKAAKDFAQYDFVVLGHGLQGDKHGDHANTKEIIKQAKKAKPKIEFFGYVPLGDRAGKDKCLTQKVIDDQLGEWSKMGVTGVLLDEFGYDYGVTRARQNASVATAHKLKLRVIANAWVPNDVFLPDDKGVKPVLNKNDIYLWESYRYANGTPVRLDTWRKKADQVTKGREALPLFVFSVSTNLMQPGNAAARFAHQWFSAAIDGHAATGWGHPSYGSNAKAEAPWVPSPLADKKPTVNLGYPKPNATPTIKGSTITLETTLGELTADTDKLDGTFKPTPKKK